MCPCHSMRHLSRMIGKDVGKPCWQVLKVQAYLDAHCWPAVTYESKLDVPALSSFLSALLLATSKHTVIATVNRVIGPATSLMRAIFAYCGSVSKTTFPFDCLALLKTAGCRFIADANGSFPSAAHFPWRGQSLRYRAAVHKPITAKMPWCSPSLCSMASRLCSTARLLTTGVNIYSTALCVHVIPCNDGTQAHRLLLKFSTNSLRQDGGSGGKMSTCCRSLVDAMTSCEEFQQPIVVASH